MNVTFKEGNKTHILSPGRLKSIPNVGDTIADGNIVSSASYLVKAVEHQGLFNDPGEHEIVISIERV